MNYLDRDVIDIVNQNGEKYIHFLGYGYESEASDDNDDRYYRIIEFIGCISPLKEVLDMGYTNWMESCYGHNAFIEDVTYDELVDSYEHWNCGKMPEFLTDLTMDTPYGTYIY